MRFSDTELCHTMRCGGVGTAMVAVQTTTFETMAWWIEAHPGLVLGFHVAVIVTALAGLALSIRAALRILRQRGLLSARLALAVCGGLVSVLVAVLFIGGTAKIGPRLLSDARVVGEDATRLRFRRLEDGTEHGIRAGGRDIVVVALWATWCRACVEEFEPLSRVHRRGDAKVFHLSNEDPETIRTFLAEHPQFDFGSTHGAIEPGGWFPAARIPTVLIVGGDGRIAGLLRGSASYEQLAWAIARVRDVS